MVWFCCVLVLGSAASAQQLPAGAGADVLKARCISCHDADMITQQRLSLTGWTNSVAKMMRWGAQVTPEEREVLQSYLATHFTTRPAISHQTAAAGVSADASAKAGEATFKRACLSCHDADMAEQQRLSKTGWTNSVNKMIRWGAVVPDAEKEPLTDYLVSRFPPKR